MNSYATEIAMTNAYHLAATKAPDSEDRAALMRFADGLACELATRQGVDRDDSDYDPDYDPSNPDSIYYPGYDAREAVHTQDVLAARDKAIQDGTYDPGPTFPTRGTIAIAQAEDA